MNNIKVITEWNKRKPAKHKDMSTDGERLFYKGALIGKHHANGCVLVPIEYYGGNNTARYFDPASISKQIGLSQEVIIELHRKQRLLNPKLSEAKSHWTTGAYEYQVRSQNKVFRVLCPELEPSENDVKLYVEEITDRLQDAMRSRGGYSSKWFMGDKLSAEPHNIYGKMNEGLGLCNQFGLDATPLKALGPLVNQAEERLALCESVKDIGGFGALDKLKKELSLPDAVPMDEIRKLLAMDEFKKSVPSHTNHYKPAWECDLLRRQIAASPLREKYGARGDRKKKEAV